MGKIKSLFNLKLVLSFLNESKKYNLVKYNKNIQSKLKLNILDYKKLSGKYIIYVENNFIEEYDKFGRIIYEGNYQKGKRHGKWKEYSYFLSEKKLIYNGEFKEGKRHGNGIEYNTFEILLHEREYKNGSRNYRGKEYSRYD